MVDSEGPTGRALELAGSATLAKARRRTAVAAVARPAAEVAGLLLVEGLGSPRGRAAALGLARSLARRPADPAAGGRAAAGAAGAAPLAALARLRILLIGHGRIPAAREANALKGA
jgi:hypothetical protein